ncbi:MAG TPA: ATP-binding protein [Bryobacteraceae bacterium]|nr:ATP-binding protein [Bryobacteraceae bacterium]
MPLARIGVLLLAPALLWGQRYSFRLYDQDAGLVNIAVNSIAEDHEGFMWAGTQNGVYRYDGRTFRRYGLADGLPSTDAQALHVSMDGILWAGTRFGLARRTGEKFVAVDLGEPVEITGAQSIRSRGSILYFATNKGLARFENGGARWLSRETSGGVYLAPDGTVWFGCGDELCRSEGQKAAEVVRVPGLPQERWGSILIDPAGTLWVRSARHLFALPKGGSSFEQRDRGLPPTSSPLGVLFAPPEGGLLSATDEGLAILQNGTWDVIDAQRGLPSETVADVLRDHEGSIWIATRGAGLARWLGFGEWETWTRAEGLSNNVQWKILRDANGNLWAGSNRGISILPAESHKWRVVTAADGLVGEKIRTLAASPNGEMWTAASPGRISRFNAQGRLMASYGAESGLSADRVYGLFYDTDSTLWVGAIGGLFHSNPTSGPTTRTCAPLHCAKFHLERVAVPGSDSTEQFFGCIRDRAGSLWCPGMRGLARLKDGQWRRFGTADGLRANSVSWIKEAADGALWLAYPEPVGVTRFTPNGDRLSLTNYSRANGLRSDKAYFLGTDARGGVWVGTEAGIDYRDAAGWHHFGRPDGLISEDTDTDAFFADADGSVWIGTSRGLSHFRPRVTKPDAAPLARIMSVEMGGRQKDLNRPIDVASSAGSLYVTFTTLSYRREHEVRFRYRIRELDQNWIETQQRDVRFTSVQPGKYTFEVAAFVPGTAPSAPARVEFSIATPWWDSWWFQFLGIAALVFCVRAAWVWRMRRELAQKRQLEAAVAARTSELALEKVRAEEGSRLKGEFLANMSHEIRTPMNGILGTVELALATALNDEQRGYLETARGCTVSLLSLIGDVLDFSKIEAGKLELDPIEFCLRTVVIDALKPVSAEAARKGLFTTFEIGPTVPERLVGDVVRVRQVLMNLLGNSVKFTERGEIILRVRRMEASERPPEKIWIEFSIRDTGIGIPADRQELIFGAFRQVDGSTTRKYGGTGLGLAISKRLVEMMGGSIGVESQPGQGACFSFTVPFEAASVTLPIRAPQPSAPVIQHSARVLVVEDNAVNQLVTSRLLEKQGMQVFIASNGAEAVETLEQFSVDFVLMDIQMPIMDGFEATAKIRESERAKNAGHTPILALTAHATKGDRERCLASGMDGYVTKPIEIDSLMAAIRACEKDAATRRDPAAERSTAPSGHGSGSALY